MLGLHLFHRWSLWVPYQHDYHKVRLDGTVSPALCEVRQRRTCVVCGKMQDEFVRGGPLHSTKKRDI